MDFLEKLACVSAVWCVIFLIGWVVMAHESSMTYTNGHERCQKMRKAADRSKDLFFFCGAVTTVIILFK